MAVPVGAAGGCGLPRGLRVHGEAAGTNNGHGRQGDAWPAAECTESCQNEFKKGSIYALRLEHMNNRRGVAATSRTLG